MPVSVSPQGSALGISLIKRASHLRMRRGERAKSARADRLPFDFSPCCRTRRRVGLDHKLIELVGYNLENCAYTHTAMLNPPTNGSFHQQVARIVALGTAIIPPIPLLQAFGMIIALYRVRMRAMTSLPCRRILTGGLR
jgi:hypothetical protein